MYLGNDVGHILTAEALAPWVEDTLDELEFILGPVSTPYGALRASLGYPEPWVVKYIEIGNEDNLYTNGSSTYAEYRFRMFYEAISEAYPDLIIISSTGDYTAVGGSGATATLTDYHTYSRPDTLVSMFNHFDHASREYKTPIGEYAIVQENLEGQLAGVDWDLPKFPYPVWIGAVSEAIWSIGAERNADAIVGMSYAPGFQNLNSYSWSVRSLFTLFQSSFALRLLLFSHLNYHHILSTMYYHWQPANKSNNSLISSLSPPTCRRLFSQPLGM